MIKKQLLIALLCGMMSLQGFAQSKLEVDFQTDIVSQNIFRGQDQGAAAIQPALSASLKGFKLEILGSVGIVNSNDLRQIDMIASYLTGKFEMGVVNYWDDEPKEPYFYFGDNSGHQFEGFLSYDFGFLSASW